MKIISHRGCVEGPDQQLENDPKNIDKCLGLGFEAEVDLRLDSNDFFLGHDFAQHKISLNWLLDRADKIWIHCKNEACIQYLNKLANDLNYFWHQNDTFTLTSKGFIWAFPNPKIYKEAINVLPELEIKDDESLALISPLGICTDYPYRYLK
ncbi:MAG: hypothetical protein CBD35_06450 [Verrucomicrobia bacterium TMED175]|nr:MAG: hypothetical protein CBD35_06450 [Verrucomicrobia bacterium TMED175]|tara:strand:- start:313 stop:768 length:456 start_codon:yes stop_codon:yes gene_type:complete